MGSIADIDTETANATRAFIEKVAARYDVAGAILFGNRARKSYRPASDADVAVLLHGRTGWFVATKLAMGDPIETGDAVRAVCQAQTFVDTMQATFMPTVMRSGGE